MEAKYTEHDIRNMVKHQQCVWSLSPKLLEIPNIEYAHYKPSDPPLKVTLTEKLRTGVVEKLD